VYKAFFKPTGETIAVKVRVFYQWQSLFLIFWSLMTGSEKLLNPASRIIDQPRGDAYETAGSPKHRALQTCKSPLKSLLEAALHMAYLVYFVLRFARHRRISTLAWS